MPRPTTRHSLGRSTAMALSASTTSSAAADDFGHLSLGSHPGSSPRSSRHSTSSPSPSPSTSMFSSHHDSGRTSQSSDGASVPRRKERQTRLQEHLRTVKPGSRQPTKPRAPSSTASKSVPAGLVRASTPLAASSEVETNASPSSSRPKRKAAQKVVMQEPESESDSDERDLSMLDDSELDRDDDETRRGPAPPKRGGGARASKGKKSPPETTRTAREREISSMSTISAGIDVEGMDEDEVQDRLEKEKNELMDRLAQHGINPQADVLDRALRALSTSNEKLTVESFLRALSSLDSLPVPAHASPTKATSPAAPPALTVQVPNSTKRVSFSTLESPSTPSSSHSSLFPSPPTKSSALPSASANTLPAAGSLLPPFAPAGSASPSAPLTASTERPQPPAPAPTSLFGTSTPGMGRIALTRRHTALGVPTISIHDRSQGPPSATLLPAFEAGRSAVRSPVRAGAVGGKSSAGLGASVSKLQSWLDDDSEDEEPATTNPQPAAASKVDGPVKASGLGPSETRDPPAQDEAMEIRVGGKTVKVLRKRQLDETEEDDEPMPPVASTSPRSAKGKGKRRALECTCGESVADVVAGSGHGTATCAECRTVYHLSCLDVRSRRQLPVEWTCERCGPVSAASTKTSTVETPSKRLRSDPHKTPPMSSQEPTFVASTFSPAPRGNFSSCPDIALAPSPTSSPVRRYAAIPTSPTPSSAKVAIPSTPQFGKDSDPRSDYSPCSPLFSRKNRSRLVSGVFDSAPFANDWAESHGPHHAGIEGGDLFGDGIASQPPFSDSLGTDWASHHPSSHSWHDVTMTPSRGLGSAAAGSGSWDTPFSSHSRRASLLHPNTLPHHRTPSQDFLVPGSALDHLHHPSARHTAPAQMFSQRLFGHSPAIGATDGSSPSREGASPLSSKRPSKANHYRNPSSSYILPPHAFSSPGSASIFSQFPPTPQSHHGGGGSAKSSSLAHSPFPVSPSRYLSSSAMKSTMSAPGLMRSATLPTPSGGLGIGFDEHDDGDEAKDHAMPPGSSFDDLLL
ncbi:hypothetical protein JCM10212_004526 [Sporobolomyces blumeae]